MAAFLGYTVDEDAVLWLTSYGWWHAYENKNGGNIGFAVRAYGFDSQLLRFYGTVLGA